MEEVGTAISHSTDEETASTSPLGSESLGGSVSLLDQGLCTSDEVREGVLLFEELPILVPLLAEITPATHLSLCIDEATIDQTEHRDAEVCIQRHPVAPIAIEEGGSRPVTLESLAIEQGHRDLHPIGSSSPATLDGIVIRREASADLLLLQQTTLPTDEIVLVERRGAVRRRIGIADRRSLVGGIALEADRVDRLGEVDLTQRFSFVREDAYLREPLSTLLQSHMLPIDTDTV